MEVTRKKSLIEPLLITAAALGIVQGLFWFLLCMGAIFFYEAVLLPRTNDIAVVNSIGDYIFFLYLDKSGAMISQAKRININLIIRPKEFNYFMYIYVVLSFSLLIASSIILWASRADKSNKFYKARIVWIINMTLLTILDLVLVCLIGHDYDQLRIVLILPNSNPILVAAGIIMTLAARGFVVWIINVIFITILGKNWYHIYRKGVRSDQQILDAYGAGSRPPWDQTNSIYADLSLGYNNKSFRDDNDNPMITSSSQSFSRLPINDRDRNKQKVANPFNNFENPNYNHTNNWNKRSQNESEIYPSGPRGSPLRPADNPNHWGPQQPLRTAKIGRQGGQRSPPLNVNPPFIPDPDYSPPGSPRVRGVLRPKSNYIMY